MNYHEIKDKRTKDMNELFTACGVFWAFSNEQFAEGRAKHPLQEGEKYLSIGSGGYLPKNNYPKLEQGMDEIEKTFKENIANFKMREKHILYELNNHECFYIGSIEGAIQALGEDYTAEEVTTVMNKYKAQKYARPTVESDYIGDVEKEIIASHN